VLLMDEPYSAVDPIVRRRLQDELVALQRRVQKTIVLVTHDIDEAIKLADRIVLLNVGGVVEQFGAPADLLRAPNNAFVAQFLGNERSLRRLALLRVADIELGPVDASNGTTPTITIDAQLREALDALLTSPNELVAVVDHTSAVVGTLTLERIAGSLS
jgi:osmoprotectant transport system ATP-binding protein